MKLRLLVCVVQALSLLAFAPNPSSAASGDFTFTLNAATPPPGLDTSLDLFTGQTVLITASGRASYGFEGQAPCVGTPLTDPNGLRFLNNGTTCPPKIDLSAIVPTAPIGKLLEQVGNGPRFPVGTRLEFQPSTGGRLRLLYNDSFSGDNSGTYNVVVQIRPTVPPPSPPPPVPPVAATFFFAEGSTQPPFDTWFLVQNPTNQAAVVRFTFEIQGGQAITRFFNVGPTSRFSLFANQILPNVAFSTRIDASQTILVERSMFVSFDGDVVTGIPAPNSTWLFAEGSTQNPFHTWLLLQNPNSQPATATITYLLLGGGTPATQVLSLPPFSRTSVFVNQVLPNAAFSSRVDSSLPIIVERAMYRFPGNAATADAGINSPDRTWFIPEGNTTQSPIPFDTFLLLQNPNPSPTTATITLFQSNGAPVRFTQRLAPTSRQTVFLNQVLPNATFGIRVDAADPIIAERSIFFGSEPRGALATPGATDPATTWFLAEGSTQPPFNEVIYILNPNAATMSAHIDFELPGGQVIGRDFTVLPTRTLTISVNDLIVNSPVSAKVTTSLPSVVERTMFFSKLGSLGGHDTIGIRG